jgi:cytochrome c oxidase assembly factor CtaG
VALAAAGVAIAAFAGGFRRLRGRGRGDLAGWGRAALFAGAVALGLLAVVSPLDAIAEHELLSAHMLQHVLIGDLVPLLLVLALRGPLLFFVVPPRLGRFAAGIGPLPAFALWLVALGVWHVPAAYDAALASPVLHGAEHASFFVAGILVWTQLVDPARRRALSPWRAIGFAAALLFVGQLLANTLILTSHVVYPAYADADLLGLSARADQDAAGLVMMLEQLATLGTFVVLGLRAALRGPLVLREDGHPLGV